MQMPEEMEPQTSNAVPILPYAPAHVSSGNRWAACSVLSTLLAGSLIGWITAVNVYGFAYGSISRIETAAAFFLALMTSVFAYVAEIVLLCAVCGPHVEPRQARAVLTLAVVPPVLWLLLARAQLSQLQGEDALLLLMLASILLTPLLVVRRKP